MNIDTAQDTLREMLDRDAIFNLVRLERFWRDQREWDRLEASYTDDGIVRVSWFEGTAREFVKRSRDMHQSGTRSKHLILPTYARINGDRALAESYGQVQIRASLEGVEYDLTSHCRFLSRVRRSGTEWRFATFEAIYIRDTIAPVNPWERLKIDAQKASKLRESYRFLSYSLSAGGYTVNQELPGDDRPDLLKPLYQAADRWLATGV
ncbi:MAG: nuclear transport factor 2 family protein [Candidatus Binataceae bacterium]|nr:nuclear transport factor 2 family protein [Candidatus Binataceae bacterium]